MELPPQAGVYVEAIRSSDEVTYYARGIGSTEKGTYRSHLLTQRRQYRSGWFNLVDVEIARAEGKRCVVWQGWSKEALERLKNDPDLLKEHQDLLERQLSITAVFIVVGGLQTERELEKIERALLDHYYSYSVRLLDDGQFKVERPAQKGNDSGEVHVPRCAARFPGNTAVLNSQSRVLARP